MATHKWNDVRRSRLSPERIEKNDDASMAMLLEMDLCEVREMAGKTQAETASIAEMAQGDISKIERSGGDRKLSTLRRYIEALGGELEIVARFGDKSVRLRGV